MAVKYEMETHKQGLMYSIVGVMYSITPIYVCLEHKLLNFTIYNSRDLSGTLPE